jgi:hypothetical protein
MPWLRPAGRLLWIWLCRNHINLIRRISSDHPEGGEEPPSPCETTRCGMSW